MWYNAAQSDLFWSYLVKIYYMRDSTGGIEKFFKYKDTIEKFKHRGSGAPGLNFEKLKVSDKAAIYSIRVNDACRILLMKYKDGYCLVDVVEKHKYERSLVFKNPLVFSRLLSVDSGETVELPSLEAFKAADDDAGAFSGAGGKRRWQWERAEDEVADDEPAAPGSLDFSPLEYHGQFITLNPEQEDVAIHPRLPLIVSGPAGSGKSSVALSMLSQYLREHRGEADAFPVLYVCESLKLVEEMRRQWQAMVGADDYALSQVDFKTYDEMVAEQLDVDAASVLGKEAFLAWYSDGRRPEGFLASAEMVWQECRIRSGYSSDREYLSLGDRQSGFKREEGIKRANVGHIYKTFLDYARGHGQIVPALEDLRARITKSYKLIVADEAQDLSFAQLLLLYRLSMGSIAFFLGDNQLLHDNLSRLPFLKAMFHSHGHDPENVVSLGLTYRCSEAVTVLANALTRIKYELTGGAADSLARMLKVADPTLGKGTASLFELKNTRERERFAELASSSRDVFIVTLPEYMAEAQETFRTGQVFTPAEVKGLGARVVILWRLLDCDMAREAARSVSPVELSDDLRAGHKAKAGVGDTRYESFGNALIVAATRAVDHVVMFEKIKHDMKSIRGRIAKALETTQSRGAELAVAESTAVDWEEQAFDLYSRGYREQAQGIFVRSLKGRLEDFEGFIDAHHRKVDEGADVAVVESMAGGAAATATAVDVGLRRVTDLGASAIGEPEAASLEVTDSDAQASRLRDALSQMDNKEKDVLLAEKENLILLRHMSEALFKSIPLKIWSSWIGKKKTPRPLLLDLVADAEHGPFLLQRLCALGLTISPEIWAFEGKTEHPGLQGTSIAYWLLMTPEGQGIFTQLPRTIDISKIITRDFLITAPPRRPGFSPLAMLIASEPGLKLLNFFASKATRVFQAIPIDVWERLHPSIRSENGNQLSLINCFQLIPNGLVILKSLELNFPALRTAVANVVKHLGLAVMNGDIASLRTVHGVGIDLSKCMDTYRFTLAMIAAKYGQAEVIRELHRLKVSLDDKKGIRVATVAISYGKIDVLRALFDCRVNFNEDVADMVPLALIAAEVGSVDALAFLYTCGVNLNRETRFGVPATYATMGGHLAALKEIYRCSPDLHAQQLLFIVAQRGYCDIAEFLLSNIKEINCVYSISEEEIMSDLGKLPYITSQAKALIVSKAKSFINELVAKCDLERSLLRLTALEIAHIYGHTKIEEMLQGKILRQFALPTGGEVLAKATGAVSATAGAELPPVATQLTQFGLLKASPGSEGGDVSPRESARPQVATALNQLGILATGAGYASRSTVSQSSSDDFGSLGASAGSFSDLTK